VKRSGKNKPMWFAIHKYKEVTLGISESLPQTSKNAMSFLLSVIVFSSTKSDKRDQNRLCMEVGRKEEREGGKWHKQCVHI
jgi:hypothetical protein